MIVFQHKPSGKFFGCSRKVLSSFFTFHPDFTLVNAVPVHYFLARNPYDRVVSLFFDKCRMAASSAEADIQINQRVLAEALLVDPRTLATVSFSQLCAALPLIADREDHFLRQTFGLALADNGRIVPIETGLAELSKVSGIDFSQRKNATDHGPWESYCAPFERRIIARVYAEDFETLRYPL